MLSGSGRTILNLLDAIRDGRLDANLSNAIASRQCPGADELNKRGLEVRTIPGPIESDQFSALLAELDIDWVVLGGYLKLVPIVPRYRGRIVNIHPALLPEFGGKGMHGLCVHKAVIEAGRTESGCTVHLCDARYDRGPIVHSRRCPVRPDDTPESLAARVFEQETRAYPEALSMLFDLDARRSGPPDPPPSPGRTIP